MFTLRIMQDTQIQNAQLPNVNAGGTPLPSGFKWLTGLHWVINKRNHRITKTRTGPYPVTYLIKLIYTYKKQCRLLSWLVGWRSLAVIKGFCALYDNISEGVVTITIVKV